MHTRFRDRLQSEEVVVVVLHTELPQPGISVVLKLIQLCRIRRCWVDPNVSLHLVRSQSKGREINYVTCLHASFQCILRYHFRPRKNYFLEFLIAIERVCTQIDQNKLNKVSQIWFSSEVCPGYTSLMWQLCIGWNALPHCCITTNDSRHVGAFLF